MTQTFPAVADWSVNKPNPLAVAAAGYTGAMRYLGTDSRCITRTEQAALHNAGLGVGYVYETTATRALSGASGGRQDAGYANQLADALGVPDTVPLFLPAIDFEATDAQVRGPVADHLRSASQVSKRPVRPYGDFHALEVLCGVLGLAPCGWQCAAWSYGQVSHFACLFQTVGYVLGASSDHNNLLMDRTEMLWHPDWSQPAPMPPTSEDDMPEQYQFPAPGGETYILVPALKVDAQQPDGTWAAQDNDATFAWQYITGPPAQIGAVAAKAISATTVQLAAGDDAADARFGAFPVLNGPHKRATHT